MLDHSCKLKGNSPQIYADFVTLITADRTEISGVSDYEAGLLRLSENIRQGKMIRQFLLILVKIKADKEISENQRYEVSEDQRTILPISAD